MIVKVSIVIKERSQVLAIWAGPKRRQLRPKLSRNPNGSSLGGCSTHAGMSKANDASWC
jgi:hypothetical protein